MKQASYLGSVGWVCCIAILRLLRTRRPGPLVAIREHYCATTYSHRGTACPEKTPHNSLNLQSGGG
jgi:hypothetical protein